MQSIPPIPLEIDAKNQLPKDLKFLVGFVFIPLLASYSFLYFFIDYPFLWLTSFIILGSAIAYIGYLVFKDFLPEKSLHFSNNKLEIRQGNRLLYAIRKTEISFSSISWQPNLESNLQAIILNSENQKPLIIGSLSDVDATEKSNQIVRGIDYYITSESDWESLNDALLHISSQRNEKTKAVEYEYKFKELEKVLAV